MHGARERFHVDRAARYLQIGNTERAARHIHRARELAFGFGDERVYEDKPGRVLAAVEDYHEPRTVPEAEREDPSLERRSYGDRARERDYGEDAPGHVLAASFGPPRGSQRRKIERWENGRDDDETREALEAREAREAADDLEAAEDAQDELDAAEQDPSIVDLNATYDVPQFLRLFARLIGIPSRVIKNLVRSLNASANGADRLDGRRLWELMQSPTRLRDDLMRRGVPDIAPDTHASDLATELAAFPKKGIPTVQALYGHFGLPYVLPFMPLG
jgi:hypothetical protein